MTTGGAPNGGNDQVTTDVVTMEVAAHQLQDSRGELEATLSSLRNTVQSASAVWKSKAEVAFESVMARWDHNAVQLNHALDGLAEGVRSSGQSYEAAVDDHAAAMARVDPEGSALNGSY